MQLPTGRVGPYVRALRSALQALAPNNEHVTLSAALDHLQALDPATSGDLLFPADVSDHTGMPAYTWLQRAHAEAVLAHRGMGDPSDAELERAGDLDAELGERLSQRRALHRHLRTAQLLPATRLGGVVRRVGARGSTQVALAYDRQSPDARWVRVRVELRTPGPPSGALWVDRAGRLAISSSLQHLFTRHFATSLSALRSQLTDATGGAVLRLSRGWTGPFWFPGVALPDGVPEALGAGLLLHNSVEVVAEDVHASRHHDPLERVDDARVPAGFGVYRSRRFAAAGGVGPAVRQWCADQGIRPLVVPFG